MGFVSGPEGLETNPIFSISLVILPNALSVKGVLESVPGG